MSFDCCACLKCFFTCGLYNCCKSVPVHPAPLPPSQALHTIASRSASVQSMLQTPPSPARRPSGANDAEDAHRRYGVVFGSQEDFVQDNDPTTEMANVASRVEGSIAIQASGAASALTSTSSVVPALSLERLVTSLEGVGTGAAGGEPHSVSQVEMLAPRERRLSISPDGSATSSRPLRSAEAEAAERPPRRMPVAPDLLDSLPMPVRPTLTPIANAPSLPPLSLAPMNVTRLRLALPHLPTGAVPPVT